MTLNVCHAKESVCMFLSAAPCRQRRSVWVGVQMHSRISDDSLSIASQLPSGLSKSQFACYDCGSHMKARSGRWQIEERHIGTFNEELGEDTLVGKGHQIERVAMILRYTCRREMYQRNFCDKRPTPA